MNKHTWIVIPLTALMVCRKCGLSARGGDTPTFTCPDWATAAGGGTKPIPGGLDALGVVKELREISQHLDDACNCKTPPLGKQFLGNLGLAILGLQQLISRLEGQGTEKPAVSEPKGQVRCSSEGEPLECKMCGHTTGTLLRLIGGGFGHEACLRDTEGL